MRQADIFLENEGDRWYERNRLKLGVHDPVTEVIDKLNIRPQSVLEVGCADGWRLEKLHEKFDCGIMGVEPSRQAGIEAAGRRVPVVQASAANLSVSMKFDMVIYAFCLYLTDPDEWLRIAAEGNAVLKAGGHLVIHDFAVPRQPVAHVYKHRANVLSYHFDFAELWLGHPLFDLVHRAVYGDEMITVLQKLPQNTIKVVA